MILVRKQLFFLCGLVFLFAPPIISAQNSLKGWSIEPIVHIGKILKHSPKQQFDPKELGGSYGFELNITSKKYGKQEWHQYHKYPKGGLSLFLYRIGEPSVFGTAIGVMPNISFTIFNKRKITGFFQMGSGIALLTNYFHPIDNPTNNSIGSKFNNISSLKFYGEYEVSTRLAINGGVSFTHFSNGASRLPNLGLNIPAVAFGIKYTPQRVTPHDIIKTNGVAPFKRFGVNIHVDYAFREHIVSGGPRYPVYIASIGGTYRFSPVNQLTTGFEYEYNRLVYVFGWNTFTFETESEARKRSSRWMFFVADELFFGNVSFLMQVGVYLPTKPLLVGFPIYNKVAIRYYFPKIGKSNAQIFAGIYLKSHKTVAEYIGYGIGATF